jgi:predicted nucleic acid-binding protein
MTTVVDSNVIVALWDRDDTLNVAAQAALDAALNRGRLLVPAPVFSELMALPGRRCPGRLEPQ